jgi:hypothetical protein
VTLLLDSGALLALERDDRAMWRRYKAARLAGTVPLSHGGVVGRAWRGGGPRQARLAAALKGVDVRPLDERLGRSVGELLVITGTCDVIDAALVLLAGDGDIITTSDVRDIAVLAEAAGIHVEIVPA